MVTIPLHTYRLSKLLHVLDYEYKVIEKNSITTFKHASEWLEIAHRINKVEVSTAKFDTDSLIMCKDAWHYDSKRSYYLSEITTQLTFFNFVWGSFENVIKVINPPHIPKTIKKKSRPVDKAIYYLKKKYDPKHRLKYYDQLLGSLTGLMKSFPVTNRAYLNLKYGSFLSKSSLGIHIVRVIRNDFAHGSAHLPKPQKWNRRNSDIKLTNNEIKYVELIQISSRLLLISIQMLLIAFLR